MSRYESGSGKKLCWVVKRVVVEVARCEDAPPFLDDAFGGEQVVVAPVAAAFGRGVGNFPVPVGDEVCHCDECPAVIWQAVVAEENSATASATPARSKLNQLVAQFAMVAEEEVAEMFDGVETGDDGWRVKLAVRRDKAEVERSGSVDAESTESRKVKSWTQFGVVNFEVGHKITPQM